MVRKEVKRHCAALAVITRMLPQIRAGCQKCREDRHLRALARAAVPIQAVVRGWIQRSKLERQKRAAVTIQAHFRGRLARTASTPEVRSGGIVKSDSSMLLTLCVHREENILCAGETHGTKAKAVGANARQP